MLHFTEAIDIYKHVENVFGTAQNEGTRIWPNLREREGGGVAIFGQNQKGVAGRSILGQTEEK